MKFVVQVACSIGTVLANVEKTIFVAPPPIVVPTQHPNLEDLRLESLIPEANSVRTRLNASFPSFSAKKGTETWILLEDLQPGRRYEIRVCWPATQPTAFWLYTHTLTDVLEDPILLASLNMYSYAHSADLETSRFLEPSQRIQSSQRRSPVNSVSVLFLQIFAAADYYTLDQALMSKVPSVPADLILDPYLMNVLPESLLSTMLYISALAMAAWVLSGFFWTALADTIRNKPVNEHRKMD